MVKQYLTRFFSTHQPVSLYLLLGHAVSPDYEKKQQTQGSSFVSTHFLMKDSVASVICTTIYNEIFI